MYGYNGRRKGSLNVITRREGFNRRVIVCPEVKMERQRVASVSLTQSALNSA